MIRQISGAVLSAHLSRVEAIEDRARAWRLTAWLTFTVAVAIMLFAAGGR
jgi:hypothetical protein